MDTRPELSRISFGSMPVMRPMGTNTFRLSVSCRTSPNARDGAPDGRSRTTTSRARPMASPSGFRTIIPDKRPAYTRSMEVMDTTITAASEPPGLEQNPAFGR